MGCTVEGCDRPVNRDGVCFKHKLATVQLDPRSTPSRRNSNPPNVNPDSNAWERGIVRDGRGVPLIGPNGWVSTKEYANNRGKYEQARKRIAHERAANTTR